MATSTIKQQNAITDISSELQLSPECTVYKAIRTGKLIELCIGTPAFSSAGEQTLGSISSDYCPSGGAILSGNLIPATGSDFGYGNVNINFSGVIRAYYSKATQYGLYATLVYFSV